MKLNCTMQIECIEDEEGLNFRVSRQGSNVSLPVYLMLLEYAKNEILLAMSENHKGDK